MLARIVKLLRKEYGALRPMTRDPFEMVLLENIAYLASDQRREQAFRELKKRVGTRPAEILAAPIETLREICALGGIVSDVRAERLREAARAAAVLAETAKLPFPKARRLLARTFPAIGEPGAEKILLFGGVHPRLALESNGVRTLRRLGFGEEQKSYARIYRSVQEAIGDQAGSDCAWLTEAHLLLKRHGQQVCKSSQPRCEQCCLTALCLYYQTAHERR